MSADLFAGIPVSTFAPSLKWYEQLCGEPPAFLPRDTEAVWGLPENGVRKISYRDTDGTEFALGGA
jgi:hypothetical protein